jgi:hypothetical protein
MRAVIIPDLHHHVERADHWIAAVPHDRVIFLGDYFDDFGDGPADAHRTASWLANRIETTADIFLLGNHDAAYLFPDEPDLYCQGFTEEKSRAIGEVLGEKHWQRFQLAHVEQGWLVSHAGFHPVWIKEPTVERIIRRCETAMGRAKRGIVDPILGNGEDRGGLQRFGGPLWMDWGSLRPIPSINQIVGHTPGDAVREKITDESSNYCIDVQHASVAGVLEDGVFRVLSVPIPAQR